MDDQGFGRITDARPLSLGVDDDAERHIEIGGPVDIDVAVAVTINHIRHGGVLDDDVDQGRSTARNKTVDESPEPHKLLDRLAAGVLDQDQGVSRYAPFFISVAENRRYRLIGSQRRGATAEQGGVPGLQAQGGGIARDIGPVLVDDPDDAERDSHLPDFQPIGPHPAVDGLADRVGEGDHLAQAPRHGRHPGLAQPEPVDGGGRGARLFAVGHVGGVSLQDLIHAGLEQVGGGRQGGVLGRGGHGGQFQAGGPGPLTQLLQRAQCWRRVRPMFEEYRRSLSGMLPQVPEPDRHPVRPAGAQSASPAEIRRAVRRAAVSPSAIVLAAAGVGIGLLAQSIVLAVVLGAGAWFLRLVVAALRSRYGGRRLPAGHH